MCNFVLVGILYILKSVDLQEGISSLTSDSSRILSVTSVLPVLQYISFFNPSVFCVLFQEYCVFYSNFYDKANL